MWVRSQDGLSCIRWLTSPYKKLICHFIYQKTYKGVIALVKEIPEIVEDIAKKVEEKWEEIE